MPQLIINPQTRKLSELLGNSTIYKVPPFQRNYSWGEEQWEDLWEDLQTTVEKTGEHYMGYVVLQEDKAAIREFQIIDGQQRLVTFSLLIMAAARRVGNQDDKAALQALYLTPKHLASHKVPTSRLKLNHTNDVFYNLLLRGNDPSARMEHKSNRKMLNALRYFEEKIAGQFCGKAADGDIIRFIDEIIAERVIFTVLNVNSEDDAYMVFETLNARGVELSSPDLLKNHLFSVAARESSPMHLAQIENAWDGISGALRGDITDFLRYYWMSLNGKVVRKKNLYREVRNSLKDPGDVLSFLDDVKNAADNYMAMQNPMSDEWMPDSRRYLDTLNLYRAKQHFPLLLAALCQWRDGREFSQLARACAVIFFRRSVCGNNPNELERAFVGATNALLNSGASCADLLRGMKHYYPDDRIFKANFAQYICPSSANLQLARHIMLALENGKFGGSHGDCTLEHILPQNPDDGWHEFDAHDILRYVGRIGNMALLDAKSNRSEAANKSFAKKKQIFAESKFAVTQECADYDEWTPSAIDARQHKLAKKACNVWSIQFPN